MSIINSKSTKNGPTAIQRDWNGQSNLYPTIWIPSSKILELDPKRNSKTHT